ncbi:MAG: hypothetical protein KC620_23480, partial [Myxococcales bacterium]|nr:hypothetical protein [Myxococcales bacterium]
ALAGREPDAEPGAEEGYFFDGSTAEGLRLALNRVTTQALAGRVTRSKPLVVAPSPGDDFGDGPTVRQVRVASYTDVLGGDDAGRYGRITAVEYGCSPGQGGDGRERLQAQSVTFFSEELADLDNRAALGRNPLDPDGGLVLGEGAGGGALFNEDGEFIGQPGFDEDAFRELVDAPRGEGGDGGDALDDVANALGGFFGGRGLVEDPGGNRVRGSRQLGEIFDGDLIAISPPALGLTNAAYVAFARDRARRPTLIAAGARDGQVHFFRLDNGLEVFTFVPRLSWRDLRQGVDNPGVGALNADGPLSAVELAECRSLGDGREGCPPEDGDVQYRTMVVGGLGAGGPNVFGIDLTNATDAIARAENEVVDADDFRAWDLVNAPILNNNPQFRDTTHQEPGLGVAVSRPIATHVRVNDEIRGAIIVGCGDDLDPDNARQDDINGTGRCVLVLDATTGETLRRFDQADGVADGDRMAYPMIGAPAVWPEGGISAAERAYIGDAFGRLWRLDLRSIDPDEWEIAVAWPPDDDDEAGGYVPGRPVVDRPSLALRDDGRLAILYGTGDVPPDPNGQRPNVRSFVVSMTDELVVQPNSTLQFSASRNWVMPLRSREFATAAPIIFDGVAYFTTIEETDRACGSRLGRLYAVHFTRAEEDTYRTSDGRDLDVVPGLPIVRTTAELVEDALSIQMPVGRIAYGLAVATTPGCNDDEGATTSL